MLRKTQSFERMKEEAQKCLKQNEQFKNDKIQFEIDVFKKVWQRNLLLHLIKPCKLLYYSYDYMNNHTIIEYINYCFYSNNLLYNHDLSWLLAHA